MRQSPTVPDRTPNYPRLPFQGMRLFYGWIIVAVGFVNQLGQGLVNQGFSAYADMLSTDFGWSKRYWPALDRSRLFRTPFWGR